MDYSEIRGTHKRYSYKGQMLSLAELVSVSVVGRGALISRLQYGWEVDEAVETPCGQTKKTNHSKTSVSADISARNKEVEKKRREVGMFATCAARSNGSRR